MRTFKLISAGILCAILMLAVRPITAQTFYDVDWTDLQGGLTVTGTTIEKTSGTGGWDASAGSQQLLAANTAGEMKFTVSQTDKYKVIGFNEGSESAQLHFNEIDYGIYLRAGGAFWIVEDGQTKWVAGTYALNDELKIVRDASGNVTYHKNGTQFYQSITASTAQMIIDISPGDVGSKFVGVQSSFNTIRLSLEGVVTHVDDGQTNGAIDLTVAGGTTPYTFLWSDNSTSEDISGLAAGTHSVTVTDAGGNTGNASFVLRTIYDVVWTDSVFVDVSNKTITKELNEVAWNAGAATKNALRPDTDGHMEFVMSDANEVKAIGLGKGMVDVDQTLGDIDYGFYFRTPGTFWIVENGGGVYTLGTYSVGDKFMVERVGDFIRYFQNGAMLREYPIGDGDYLYVDASLNSLNSSFSDIKCSFNTERLEVIPTITHGIIGGPDGSISLAISGGQSDYDVVWNDGTSGATYAGLAPGEYTATITDDLGAQVIKTYDVWDVRNTEWVNLRNMSDEGSGTLKVQGGYSYETTGAQARHLLLDNTDGYVEYEVDAKNNWMYMNFREYNDNGLDYKARFHGLYQYGEFVYRKYKSNGETGATTVALADVKPGDVLGISRKGAEIRYYLNGEILFSETAISSGGSKWQLEISSYFPSHLIKNVRDNFSYERLHVEFDISQKEDVNGGSIAVTTSGGQGDYTYSWSSGQNYGSLSGLNAGEYILTTSDTMGDVLVDTIDIWDIRPVEWVDAKNMELTGGGSLKSNGSNTENSSVAHSKFLLLENVDGYFEFETDVTSFLSNVTMDNYDRNEHILNTRNHGIFLYGYGAHTMKGDNGSAGASQVKLDYAPVGSIIGVGRRGGIIRYYINGEIVYREPVLNADKIWHLEAHIRTSSYTLKNVKYSFDYERFDIETTVVHKEFGEKGSITNVASGGTTPYNFVWSTGATSESLQYLNDGEYVFTAWDSAEDTITDTIDIWDIRPIEWEQIKDVDIDADGTLTANLNQWDSSGAKSVYKLLPDEDGYVEYEIDVSFFLKKILLKDESNDSLDHKTRHHGIYQKSTQMSSLSGNEGAPGATQTLLNRIKSGDKIGIGRKGNEMRYYINGKIVHREPVNSPGTTWQVEAQIFTASLRILKPKYTFGVPTTEMSNISFSEMKDRLDGSSVKADDGFLYFRYDEQYNDADLQLRVLKRDGEEVAIASLSDYLERADYKSGKFKATGQSKYGANYFKLRLTCGEGNEPGLGLPSGYYVIEIRGQKGKKQYLRAQVNVINTSCVTP